MTNRNDDGAGRRVDGIERQLSALSASVDKRFDAVDERFDSGETRIAEGFAEQRRYTEFAFERLSTEMRSGLERLERKLDRFIDTQLQTNELVDRRLRALEGPGLL